MKKLSAAAKGLLKAGEFSALFNSYELSIQSNQFQASVETKSSNFIHVGSEGSIIRSIGNGIFETLSSNFFSYLSAATRMSLITNNQGSHAIRGIAPENIESNNQVMP